MPETSKLHEASETERANELAAFFGGTNENGETFFTIGVEYERRISPLFGASIVVEHISGLDAWVFLAPFSIRPVKGLGLKLYAGPGLENKAPRPEEEPGGKYTALRSALATAAAGERETFFTVRTGVAWALEWNRLSFTPQIEVDFTRETDRWEHALVFGVAIGFGF